MMPVADSELTHSLFSFLNGGGNALLTLIFSAITVFLTIMKYRQTKLSQLGPRRLEAVISPLFELLEPSMMQGGQHPTEETVSAVLNLIVSNQPLAGGRLRSYRNLSSISPSFSEDWQQLCLYVSREYDQLCFALSIPLRTILFRARNYKPRYAVLPIIALVFMAVAYTALIIAVIAAFALCVSAIYTQNMGLLSVGVPILAALLFLCLLANPRT